MYSTGLGKQANACKKGQKKQGDLLTFERKGRVGMTWLTTWERRGRLVGPCLQVGGLVCKSGQVCMWGHCEWDLVEAEVMGRELFSRSLRLLSWGAVLPHCHRCAGVA